MNAIIDVESGGRQLAVHVNHWAGPQPHPATFAEAAAVARRYIDAGFSVDLGLSQLNSGNLDRLGYTVEDALEPCKNIAAGASILSAFYGVAVQRYGEGQRALMGALSAYNSGSLTAGFTSGYVAKYYINARLIVPQPRIATRQFPTTVAYDRPGLDLRLNRDE